MSKSTFKIEGWKELENAISKLEKLPRKHVSRAAKAGAKIALADARANAPFLSGELERGIVLKAEKTRIPAKKVYDIKMDPAKNGIFQAKNKDGKITGYYPASQEYGFMTRNGGYVPGLHFMKKSLTDNKSQIEKTIVDTMLTEIEKIKAK